MQVNSVGATSQTTAQQTNLPGTTVITEVLTLRLAPRRKKKAVSWAEDVVDNESLGRKSSKKCCIFHKNLAFGEWSDSEDDDAECEDCSK